MTCLSTLGIGLLLLQWASPAHADDPLSHDEVETAELTAGLGQCGLSITGPLRRSSPTCSPSLMDDFGTDPGDWHPWTHRPYCADTPYCVFTNAHFHGNHGISIITTPELAAGTLDSIESTFTTPFQPVRPGPHGPAFEIRDVPGKGKGVVAVRRILRGEKLMVDYAGVIADTVFPQSLRMADGRKLLEVAVDQLPRGAQIRNLAMSTATESRVVEDLLRTNSFGMVVEERSVMALFPEISRLNHACNPSIYTRFSERTLAMTAVAMRDVEPGEELTISYAESGLTRPQRQDFLRARWGFQCTCTLCAAPDDEALASDARRERMSEARDKVLAHVRRQEARKAIGWHLKMLDLIAEEGLVSPLGEHYEIIARLYGAVGDRRGTEEWAARAIEEFEVYGGEEVYEQIGELEELLSRARAA